MKTFAVIGALFALGLAPAAAISPEPPRISDLADELQRIQIRMAEGDRAAYADQLKQLKTMSAAIAGAPLETWKSPGEADALILYLLSGGPASDAAALLAGDAIVESRRALARAAAAYIAGRSAEAAKLLNEIDAAELSPRLAGQVAFARSVLAANRDPKGAIAFLDWARLIAPGTLVEEAALRREIALVAQARDAPRAAMLIRQYAARFPASLYAADFFRKLARLAAEFAFADEPADRERIKRALAPLPVEAKRAFWLAVAKALTIGAQSGPGQAAAEEASAYVRPDSEDGLRARLYLDASRMLSGDVEAPAADLRTLASSKLDRSDAALLAYARGVAAQLLAAPSPAAIAAQAEAATEDDDPGSALGLAAAALKRTADLMERQTP